MEKENENKEGLKGDEEPCCSESEMINCCPKPKKKEFKCRISRLNTTALAALAGRSNSPGQIVTSMSSLMTSKLLPEL